MKNHRNKFVVVFALLMVVVFSLWVWPAKQGTGEAINSGTKDISNP